MKSKSSEQKRQKPILDPNNRAIRSRIQSNTSFEHRLRIGPPDARWIIGHHSTRTAIEPQPRGRSTSGHTQFTAMFRGEQEATEILGSTSSKSKKVLCWSKPVASWTAPNWHPCAEDRSESSRRSPNPFYEVASGRFKNESNLYHSKKLLLMVSLLLNAKEVSCNSLIVLWSPTAYGFVVIRSGGWKGVSMRVR